MSNRYRNDRFALVALALLLAAIILVGVHTRPHPTSQQQIPQDATQNVDRGSDSEYSPVTPVSFLGDGGAQWIMALFSMAATVISWWAVSLVRDTFVQTKRTADAAIEANATAREIGKDQSRAYVHADSAEIRWHGVGVGAVPYVLLEIINTGGTPARWFEYQSTAYAKTIAEGDVDPWSTLEGAKRWGNLGGGRTLTFPIGNEDTVRVINHARKNNEGLLIQGVIRYETFFGEVFDTEFSFFGRNVIGPQHKRVAEPVSGVMNTNTFTLIEVPQRLSRSNRRLRSYERVEDAKA